MPNATFFDRQNSARRLTRLLLAAEVLFVLLLSLGTYFLLETAVYLIHALLVMRQGGGPPDRPEFSLWGFLAVGAATMTIVLTSTYRRYRELRKGGVFVAKQLGCRRIYPSTEEPREKLLLNIVDEISIAAGRPPPLIFILQDEGMINAFAAGWRADGAVIGLSAGALQYLDRDELQGVVAHEFSHILNGDVQLNMTLSAVIHGVNIFHVIGHSLLSPPKMEAAPVLERPDSIGITRRFDAVLPFPLFIVGALFYGYGLAGRLFATLLCAAVSRQREILADAHATQYTRNPAGIAGALKKIGGLQGEIAPTLARMDSCGHFFFTAYTDELMHSLLSSHPPLTDRIRLLDESFDGVYTRPHPVAAYDGRHLQSAFYLATTQDFSRRRVSMRQVDVSDFSGVVSAAGLDLAAALIEQIPQSLRLLASEPYGARAVLYALMLSRDEEQMVPQVDVIIHNEIDELIRDRTALAVRLVRRLDFAYYLPLVDLAVLSLRELSADEYEHFKAVCSGIAAMKPLPDDLDYAITAIVERQLAWNYKLQSITPQVSRATEELSTAASMLLALLARCGAASDSAAKESYRHARTVLGIREVEQHLPPPERSLDSFRRFVQLLAVAELDFKRRFLMAGAAAIEHDGFTSVKEWTMLQAVAQSIGVPLAAKPPLEQD
ncbi:MAG: M48 family metalloprotease [Bdellovibrionota bacterium]|nr:MAG: M48 family metalloprotease [Bdellovibrionota bacterium]